MVNDTQPPSDKLLPKKRRIIQITSCGVVENEMTQCEMMLHALCDDGTVWQIDNRSGKWWPFTQIPQGNCHDR